MDNMTNNTTNQDVEAAIISKIEALFRQANHPNTGQAEREAFHAKAIALMEKHRIASVEWEDPSEAPADYEFGWCKGLYTKAHQAIVGAVASMYGVRHYYMSSGRPGDPARRVFLFGFKRDCERVKHLANEFILDAMTQAKGYKDPHGGYGASDRTTNWRKSFMMGYATEIGIRYQEAKRQMEREQPGYATTGNALVLVTRKEQVDEAYSQKNLRRTSSRTQGMNYSAYNTGREAGRNSNVGRGRVGSGRGGALGSGS